VSQVISTPLGGAPQIVATNIVYQPFGGVKSYALGSGQTYTRDFDLDGRIASYKPRRPVLRDRLRRAKSHSPHQRLGQRREHQHLRLRHLDA